MPAQGLRVETEVDLVYGGHRWDTGSLKTLRALGPGSPGALEGQQQEWEGQRDRSRDARTPGGWVSVVQGIAKGGAEGFKSSSWVRTLLWGVTPWSEVAASCTKPGRECKEIASWMCSGCATGNL